MTNFYFENKDSFGNVTFETFSTVVEKIVTSSGKTIAFPKMAYKPSEKGGFDTAITIKKDVVIDFRFFKMEKLEEIKKGLIACYCGQLASATGIKHDKAVDNDNKSATECDLLLEMYDEYRFIAETYYVDGVTNAPIVKLLASFFSGDGHMLPHYLAVEVALKNMKPVFATKGILTNKGACGNDTEKALYEDLKKEIGEMYGKLSCEESEYLNPWVHTPNSANITFIQAAFCGKFGVNKNGFIAKKFLESKQDKDGNFKMPRGMYDEILGNMLSKAYNEKTDN